MTGPLKFALQSDDGEQKFINIEPDIEGGSHSNGVYRLYMEGKEHRYIGDIAFHQEGADEWIYTGYDLSDNEQEQVAEYIQNNEGF
jgi:hypothetical protein